MVFGQERQRIRSQIPGSAVAYVQDDGLAASQDETRESRRCPCHAGVAARQTIEPTIEAIHGFHRGGTYSVQGILRAIAIEKIPDCKLRSDPSALVASDAIGEGNDDALQCALPPRFRDRQRQSPGCPTAHRDDWQSLRQP